MRYGDRTMLFTPHELKTTETETQGWIQFETAEYILEEPVRDAVSCQSIIYTGVIVINQLRILTDSHNATTTLPAGAGPHERSRL